MPTVTFPTPSNSWSFNPQLDFGFTVTQKWGALFSDGLIYGAYTGGTPIIMANGATQTVAFAGSLQLNTSGGSGLGISQYDASGAPTQISFPCECCGDDYFLGCGELSPCSWPPFPPSSRAAHATLSSPGCMLDGMVVALAGTSGVAPPCYVGSGVFVMIGTGFKDVCFPIPELAQVRMVRFRVDLCWYCDQATNRLHLTFTLYWKTWEVVSGRSDFGANCPDLLAGDGALYHPPPGPDPIPNYCYQYSGNPIYIDLIGGGACLNWVSQTFTLPVGFRPYPNTGGPCYYLNDAGCSGASANWIITP